MEATAGRCIRCGGGLPVRVDPRGRPARYCSDACRASASRERASAGARAARVQAEARAYERGKKDGYAEGWAEALRASTGRAGARMEWGVPRILDSRLMREDQDHGTTITSEVQSAVQG